MRKAIFTPPNYVFVQKVWDSAEPVEVTLHGFFPFRDGDEAGVIALIELPNGKLLEISTSHIQLLPETTSTCECKCHTKL